MPKIFISHNHQDKPLARKIKLLLEDNGFDTWLDEVEIDIGNSLISKIVAGIIESDYIIAIISPNSQNSKWVHYELRIAATLEVEKGKPVVIPIIIAEAKIPDFLIGKVYLKLAGQDDLKANEARLLKALGHTAAFNTNAKFSDLRIKSDDKIPQVETYIGEDIVFKKPIYKIRANWKVHYPYQGMKFSRKWYKDGELWREKNDVYDKIWNNGDEMSTFIHNRWGHPAGDYSVRLYIDDQYQCSIGFRIIK